MSNSTIQWLGSELDSTPDTELDDQRCNSLWVKALGELVQQGSSTTSATYNVEQLFAEKGIVFTDVEPANEPSTPNSAPQPAVHEPLHGKAKEPRKAKDGRCSADGLIDAESKELLRYINEDFVLLTTAGGVFAYHRESGDKLNKEAFIPYCAKHYGTILLLDEEGNVTDRVSSGDRWWKMEDPERLVVKSVVMEPTMVAEHEGDPTAYNRWYTLRKSMVEPNYSATQEDIAPLLEHLLFISDGDDIAVLYFLNWLATLYQFPGTKIPVAILMYSKFGGVGKSIIHRLLSKVFGKPLVTACTGKVLQKNFDDAIEHKRIVFINEVARSEKADGYENFKSQISEEDAQFEGKGRAAKEIRNIAHYIITTNNLDALPMMQGDRRIAVLMCNEPPRDAKYYKRLVEWIDGPGAPALANVLRTWEFPADWNAHAPAPQTEAARNMQKASRDELELLLAELVEAGTEPCDKDIIIVDDLCAQMNTLFSNSLRRPANRTSVGKALQALHAERCEKRIEGPDGKTPNRVFYLIRNSEQWKEATPKQRGDHLKTGARLFAVPVETKVSEVNGDEQ